MASRICNDNELAVEMYKQACYWSKLHSVRMNKGSIIYRNKTWKYFDDIIQQNGCVMQPYKKDTSGDPNNPTNGRLDGLFFSATVSSKTGRLPNRSPFGPCRLSIPIHFLLSNFYSNGWRLFFADFYCININKPHYVMVVMCEYGTDDYSFCMRYLLPLPKDNPFCMIAEDGKSFRVSSKKIWVEVFYIKDINIIEAVANGARFSAVKVNRWSSSISGKPKPPECIVCNRSVMNC